MIIDASFSLSPDNGKVKQIFSLFCASDMAHTEL
jgi:hypothetical protein